VVGGIDPQSGAGRSARGQINAAISAYGLSSSLGDSLYNKVLANIPVSQIFLDMRQTPEYKARFPAMAQLQAKGRAISETQYLDLERSYTQTLREAGIPPGFYDQPDDFNRYIANEVSPAELQQRVSVYQKAAYEAPQETRNELQLLYGIGPGELTAYFMDPDRAEPVIMKQFQTAQVAGQALRAGLSQLNVTQAERFGALDPNEIAQRINLYEQASVGARDETKQELARLYGITDLTGTVVNPDIGIALLKQRIQAGTTAGESLATGFGQLSQSEAETLGPANVSQQTFQQVAQEKPLFSSLPGSAENDISRQDQIDLLGGDQTVATAVEGKRATRKAEFQDGGQFAQTKQGFTGVGVAGQ